MKFNLSEWALNNKGIILYLMLLLPLWGLFLTLNYHKVKIRLLPLK